MKRSVLLNLIQAYINHREDINRDVLAHTILDIIEEAGMLPPLNKSYEFYSQFAKWEPEND